MSKKKSKTQKKKFFSNPKNKKFFLTAGNKALKPKKVQNVAAKVESVLRKRGAFVVLSTSGCPCLLFGEKENGEVKKRFFACAVYRLKEFPETSTLVFCHECVNVFETKHKCPSQVVTKAQLRSPSRLLDAKVSQSGEAQFFFSDESLDVLKNAVVRSGADAVLCLGAPRLFETLRNDATKKRKLFMLDYDKRYANFFPTRQYAQYSMLVDHFFSKKGQIRLQNFFAESEKVLLVCDPPFGVFIEPLMASIDSLMRRYTEARKDDAATFYACIVIPMFVGKYILRSRGDFWMSDYRVCISLSSQLTLVTLYLDVTYDNHKVFSKASKTTVRCFTNMSASVFDLSGVEGYKFCEFCERYVANANKHCFMCSACTSKDGSPYKHCERCMRCVKNTYRHCKKCERCHLEGRCSSTVEYDDRGEGCD
uniref:Zinc finger CCHC domain-containing protein 4 n=1 Tax=Nippostrongylus brasiliensis TaxID=27835 RepID=A0A158R010_NIPBR